ncbi:Transient receptor potential channel pyrexia [Folsomia candida]|uniref:Transient receptor potential channel pyrexia n=1 Tax=Folsomia candida TaxID=158441 RepID=A0A226ESM4_FOLCA|nr:Transient receptor potential channel pyrexia [Folsomia candida]
MTKSRVNFSPGVDCHQSAYNLDSRLLDLTLHNIENINNLIDEMGNTLATLIVKRVHECACNSCIRKGVNCLQVLANHGADFEEKESRGHTPLYLAVKYKLLDVAQVLIENGALLNNGWNFYGMPLLFFVEKNIPDILSTTLNSSFVTTSYPSEDYDNGVQISCDMSMLFPNGSNEGVLVSDNLTKITPLAQEISLSETQKENVGSMKNEMSLLLSLVNTHQKTKARRMHPDLYRHPLVHIFMDLKWKKLHWIKLMSILIQIGMLLSYTGFIVSIMFYDCPNLFKFNPTDLTRNIVDIAKINISHTTSTFQNVHNATSDLYCEIQFLSRGFAVYYAICGMVMMVIEMRICSSGFRVWMSEMSNHTHIMSLASGLFSILISFSTAVHEEFPATWICKAGSDHVVSSIPLALIKMLTMMVGEVEYSSLFDKQVGNNIDFMVWGHIWYVAALIAVTLGCLQYAEMETLIRCIVHAAEIERIFLLLADLCPSEMGNWMANKISLHSAYGNKFVFNTKYNDPVYKLLSIGTKHLIQKHTDIPVKNRKSGCKFERKRTKNSSVNIKSDIENQTETNRIMSRMEHKLDEMEDFLLRKLDDFKS